MPSGSIRIPMLRDKQDPLFFLAEWSDPHLLSTFNADYGWELHHMMNDIAKGHKNVQCSKLCSENRYLVYGEDAMKLYFTSNHDENSWQGSAMSAWATMPCLLCLAYDGASFPLLYTGQEAGIDISFPFFSKDTVGVNWSANRSCRFLCVTFLSLKHNHPALWNGAYGGEMNLTIRYCDNTL